MTVFEFVTDADLPPARQRGAKANPLITEFAEALRARPNQWGKYPIALKRSTASGLASHINKHGANANPQLRDGFEATVRQDVLYIRFIGATA